MKRRLAFSLALFLSAAAQAATPAVLDLNDVSPLRDWFQSHGGSVRMIALLSPSCTSCLQGFLAVQKTLSGVGDPRLQAAVVWIAVMPGDQRASAVSLSTQFTDGRLTYFWDPYRAAGETWQAPLKLKGAAWDLYLLYGPSATWNEPDLDPGPPNFWMHQLKEVPQAPVLDQKQLEQKIRTLLQ